MCPLPLVLSLGTTGMNLTQLSLHTLFRCLCALIRYTWTFHFPVSTLPVFPHRRDPSVPCLCDFSLDYLQYCHLSFVMRSLELDKILEVLPHLDGGERPLTSTSRTSNAAQNISTLFATTEHRWLMLTLVSTKTHRFSSTKLLAS